MSALERFAPLPLQEGWDNAGLQIGLTEAEVSGALLCLDVNEAIVDEAIEKGCNLIVSHLDHETIRSLRSFQKFAGLPETGNADRVTWKNLSKQFTLSAHRNASM